MTFWRSLQIDSLMVWTKEQVEEFQKITNNKVAVDSWEITNLAYDIFVSALRESPYANELLPYFDKEEFYHWLGVVYTRNHGIEESMYLLMRETNFSENDYSIEEEETRMQRNI